MIYPQMFGWLGTFLILCAYFLVSTKKVKATSGIYQLFNLLGALGVGVNVFFQHAYPALALQIVWGLIALFSLLKINTRP